MDRLIRSMRSLGSLLFEGAVIHGGNALIAVIDGSDHAQGWLSVWIGRFRALSDTQGRLISTHREQPNERAEAPSSRTADGVAHLARPGSRGEAELHVYGVHPYNRRFCACEIRQYGTNALRQCRRVTGYGPEGLYCAHHAAALAAHATRMCMNDAP